MHFIKFFQEKLERRLAKEVEIWYNVDTGSRI